jgi:UDP-glucose 4-epimerase
MSWGKSAVPDKDLKTTKFLVTGGAGYIGSHTVYALLEAGAEVAVIDNLSTGFRQAVHHDARFWQGDLLDREFLSNVFREERPQMVIHFAASSQVAESMREPLAYYKNNVEGTRVLLEAVMDHGPGRLVFSSSAAVYGEPDRLPIEEDTALRPASVYGETKKVMENLMSWCSRTGGLRYVARR